MARTRGTSVWIDQVIEAYKPGVDWTLNFESLKKSPEERLNMLWGMQDFVREVNKVRERPAVDFWRVLTLLAENQVDFIVAGGVAATLHGSAKHTNDLDIIYSRKKENLSRIVETLRPFGPYPRGAPPNLPYQWDIRTLSNGLNFTLVTDLGWLNLLGEIVAGGKYEDLLPHSVVVQTYGVEVRYVDLDTLIRLKRAAGRPKDFEAIAELEIIRDLKK